jgi:hypothetical protein
MPFDDGPEEIDLEKFIDKAVRNSILLIFYLK